MSGGSPTVRQHSFHWPLASLSLLGVWTILRCAGLASGLATNGDPRLPPGWISLSTTAVLAVAAWVHAFGLRRSSLRRRALLVAVGVTSGLGGDFALSGLVLPEDQGFLAGVCLFGLGHLAYLAAMLAFARTLAAGSRRRILGAWTVAAAGSLWGWFALIFHAEVALGAYVWAILGYAFLLASTAGVGLGLATVAPRLWPLAAGGLLFVASDCFIILRLFNPERDTLVRTVTSLDWTWLAYSPAQLLIVYTMPWVILGNVLRRHRTLPVGTPPIAVDVASETVRDTHSA